MSLFLHDCWHLNCVKQNPLSYKHTWNTDTQKSYFFSQTKPKSKPQIIKEKQSWIVEQFTDKVIRYPFFFCFSQKYTNYFSYILAAE